MLDPQGQAFAFEIPHEVFRLLHFVDQHCSGEIAMPEVVTADEQARQHYLVNSLMEEVIRSSQLEGETTSHPGQRSYFGPGGERKTGASA